MKLPFTPQEFFNVFARYNDAVWPAPLVLPVLAGLAVFAMTWKWRSSDRIAGGVLAILWFWSGVVYHLIFFREINSLAIGFGLLFLVQAAGFLRGALRRTALHFSAPRTEPRTLVGALVITYALVIYPLLSDLLGHRWPHAPTFGAPCPIVLFTLGLFFWTDASRPRAWLIIPLGWSLVGTSAAVTLSVFEDFALPVVGLLAAGMLLPRDELKSDSNPARPPSGNLSHGG